MRREAIAIPAVVLLYLYIMELPASFFFFLLLFAVIVAQAEFYVMYNTKRLLQIIGVFFGSLFLYTVYIKGHINPLAQYVILFFLLFSFLARLLFYSTPEGALKDLSSSIIGFFYIPFLLSFLIFLRLKGPEWIIYTIAVVWISDSCAYYIGKNLGKRKLMPSVSPKKTVEGAVGSIGGGAIGSLIIKALIIKKLPYSEALLLGIFVGVSAILGDLTESMFKRDAGVKDSSHLIPGGHGGVLDKFDGIIFATVVVFFYLRFFV